MGSRGIRALCVLSDIQISLYNNINRFMPSYLPDAVQRDGRKVIAYAIGGGRGVRSAVIIVAPIS